MELSFWNEGKKNLKGRWKIYRPFKFFFPSKTFLLPFDEQFTVLLRTCVSSRRSNNGLHGGTSISSTSPPSVKKIVNAYSSPCQGEKKESSEKLPHALLITEISGLFQKSQKYLKKRLIR
jgi:hypothetical protein